MQQVLWKISNLMLRSIIQCSRVSKNQESYHFSWKNKLKMKFETFFNKLDIAQGYHQIVLGENQEILQLLALHKGYFDVNV